MDTQYSPELLQWAEGWPLLEKASAILDDILRRQSSGPVKAVWNRVQDRRGQTLYRLTVNDFTDEVFTDFTLAELQNRLLMQQSLARLWGHLLQIRVNRQHELVQLLSSQATANEEG